MSCSERRRISRSPTSKHLKTSVTTLFAPVTTTARQKLEWLSTTRLRAGYTVVDNLLLYGTGGLATGRASGSSAITLVGCPGFGKCPTGSDAKTLWGWAAGGGMEYAMGHWSVNVEYLHYDLGHLNYNMTDLKFPTAFIATSTKFSGDVVHGGISYRFDWTMRIDLRSPLLTFITLTNEPKKLSRRICS